jgi:hypothetical protein
MPDVTNGQLGYIEIIGFVLIYAILGIDRFFKIGVRKEEKEIAEEKTDQIVIEKMTGVFEQSNAILTNALNASNQQTQNWMSAQLQLDAEHKSKMIDKQDEIISALNKNTEAMLVSVRKQDELSGQIKTVQENVKSIDEWVKKIPPEIIATTNTNVKKILDMMQKPEVKNAGESKEKD